MGHSINGTIMLSDNTSNIKMTNNMLKCLYNNGILTNNTKNRERKKTYTTFITISKAY
jgi:hypothetical protein